jgi:CxxC motif-containing protein
MREITCIVCPNGCRITAELKDGQYVFSGNKCVKGEEFARTELTAPKRSVCTTVRTVFRGMPALPVRTNGDVPKGMIPDIIRTLGCVVVSEEIHVGETVVHDILGTGCDVIATSDLLGRAAGKEDMPC